MKQNRAIVHLIELARKLPPDIKADWRGTRHYELTSASGEQLAMTLAMLLIHIASKDGTLEGALDRVIQFALAYVLVAWAMRPNAQNEAREDRAGKNV